MAVDKLAQTGIKRIEGNIVIDRSYFNIPQVDPGAFDGRSSRPYNLQPDPALINYRNLSFDFIPDKETQTARIVTVPKLAGISFPETIPLGRGGCGDWKTSIGFQLKDLGKGRKRVTFTGKLPAACGNPTNTSSVSFVRSGSATAEPGRGTWCQETYPKMLSGAFPVCRSLWVKWRHSPISGLTT